MKRNRDTYKVGKGKLLCREQREDKGLEKEDKLHVRNSKRTKQGSPRKQSRKQKEGKVCGRKRTKYRKEHKVRNRKET